MAAHSYWRLLIRGRNPINPNFLTISEIQFRATPGGAQLAVGGTASADSSSSSTPDRAFDGNTGTHWENVSSNDPRWIQYAFASPVDVAEVSIRSAFANEGPQTFDVQWSDDGAAWTTAAVVSIEPAWAAGETRVFPVYPANPTGLRFWRLNIAQTGVVTLASVATLALRTAPGGASVATGGKADASSGVPALRAFDADPATFWQSATVPAPWWLRYRLPSELAIVEYSITAPAGTVTPETPRSWTLEHSGDGVSWTVADTRTGQQAWTPGETRTFSANPVTGRRPAVFVAT